MHSRSFQFSVLITLALIMSCVFTQAQASWVNGSIAQLQALDKITARISTLAAPIGEPVRFGTLEIVIQRCAFRPPEEPPENVAFLEIVDRGHEGGDAPRRRFFSGWMFSSSPAVSAMEHPVYDVTLLKCSID